MKTPRWSRKIITLPGCEFAALVDADRADKWGRLYAVWDIGAAWIYPDCISDPKPEQASDFEKLETTLGMDPQPKEKTNEK